MIGPAGFMAGPQKTDAPEPLTTNHRLPEKGDVLSSNGDIVHIEGWANVLGMPAAVCAFPGNRERQKRERYAVNLAGRETPMIYVSRADGGPVTVGKQEATNAA